MTYVWVRLVPELLDGKPAPISFTVKAFFPGRAARDVYTGLPEWPKGAPARLVFTAEASPVTFFKGLSVQMAIDGRRLEMTGRDSHFRNIPCMVTTTDCTPIGVEIDLDVATLRSLTTASSVEGEALGFPFRLTADDRAALAELETRVNLRASGGGAR
jgi:hypothetical protein